MGNDIFQKTCINIVAQKEGLSKKDVYIVWMVKVLQNNKALVSTNQLNGMYYEITFNGDKEEFYLDYYTKTKNEKIDLREEY